MARKIKNHGKLLTIYFLAIVGGILVGVNLKPTILPALSFLTLNKTAEELSAKGLSGIIKEDDVFLVNVHSPYEGEIAGTDAFIAYDEMKANADKLPTDKNMQIVLYCKTGRMSAEALKTLKGMGYTNVSHLDGGMDAWQRSKYEVLNLADLPSKVLPEEGFELPITWGDLGPRMIAMGVIDKDKFIEATKPTDEEKKILIEGTDEKLKIDTNKSRFVVNMLWAAGLAQRSVVYTEGPMGKEYKKDIGNFSSTGGWSLARGLAVNHLGQHNLVDLSPDQEKRVAEIAKNVYRPCCGNSTYFPDCNHGMAALFAIEAMVAQNLSDEEIYKNVLKLNSFWFPDTYLAVATYFARQGQDWQSLDSKEALGANYSSSQGAQDIYTKVGDLPYEKKTGGSCGA